MAFSEPESDKMVKRVGYSDMELFWLGNNVFLFGFICTVFPIFSNLLYFVRNKFTVAFLTFDCIICLKNQSHAFLRIFYKVFPKKISYFKP